MILSVKWRTVGLSDDDWIDFQHTDFGNELDLKKKKKKNLKQSWLPEFWKKDPKNTRD